MSENLIKRIGDAYLNPTFTDGAVLLHTELNEIVSVTKTGINTNYYDIQRIINGTEGYIPANATKLNGATLSKFIDGELENNDNTVPTSQQVKAYIDAKIAEIS